MNNILKNIFRYICKNKIGYFAIFILMSLAIMIFAAFSNLAIKINTTYDNLVNNYNLHNIVINEKYSINNEEKNKQEFRNFLTDNNVNYREFNSINITNTEDKSIIKIIEYLSTYDIDRLKIFDPNNKLPKNDFDEYTLPNSIDFNEILSSAAGDVINKTATTDENIYARQKIVYFATKSNFTNNSFLNKFNNVFEQIKKDNLFDPLNPINPNSDFVDVAKYMKSFLDPSDSNYTPITIRGQKIIISLTQFNNGIPCLGYFEDPYSYIAVASNYYLERNGKEIYSYEQFQKDLLNTSDNINIISENWLNLPISKLPNLKTTLDFQEFINNIDDKYKIYLDNIPYLIIGSGITPDFIYPVLSFSNIIPNPKNEGLLYANKNGYLRSDNSFGSMPHEVFLVSKYNGNLTSNQILDLINDKSRQLMNWPNNVNSSYWYNDNSNQITPTAARVNFITTLINSFVAVAFLLSIFIVVLILLVMILFSKNFINKNKNTIGILISNGLNKNKVLFCLSFATSFSCILSGVIGLSLAFFLEKGILGILNNYWFLPTVIKSFGIGWLFFASFIPTLTFMLIVFLVGKK